MLAFHMLYRWVCISPSRGSGEPKEAHSRTLKLYNMISMFLPGVGAADGLTLSKFCICPSCQLAFLSLSLSLSLPPPPPHSTPCTLGTASLEHSPSEHLAGGGPRDSCPFFYGQPSRPEYSRDILGLTVRPGLAGWGRLGGRLQTVFSSLQGRGWPGTRAVSEVAAKLAGEGTWPHKPRPRLGPRQQRLGRGCEGENLTTCAMSRGGKGARTLRQMILSPSTHTL